MERFDIRGEGRREDFFGFDWEFALTDSTDFPGEGTGWRPVQLPHDWSTDYPVSEDAPALGSGGYARTGIGWYRRRFTLAKETNTRTALRFEGVYMHADVWLNGIHLGGHVYGYTPFELDITAALLDGENELLVRVDNSHQPNSRWYSGSGITREVTLVRTATDRIAPWGVWVSAEPSGDGAQVAVEVEVERGGGSGTLELDVQLADGGTALAGTRVTLDGRERQTVRLTLSPERVERWDVERPKLYEARATLLADGAVADALATPFGVRDIAFDSERGFSLNGRKLLLKGVCLHHDGGCVGAAVPPELWRRRLEKLKTMGCNALRMSHNPPDPALLDLADALGFVVLDEAFDEWRTMKFKTFGSNTHDSRGYSEWYDGCWQDDVTAMVKRDRNHPGVVMWSVGNEIAEQVSDDGWKLTRALVGLVHALDPTRPVTAACDQEKAEPFETTEAFLDELDIVGVNYPDRWRERTESFLLEEKREHPERLYMGTEDVAVNGPRGDARLETEESVWGRTPYYAHMLKAEKLWKFIRTNPWMIGDFMWTGVDYLGECFWPDKNSSAGVLDTCGFEKAGYWFYRSVWTSGEPVLYLWPHLNLALSEGAIYPLVCYTNCFSVELFVDGKSYGTKAYEFPAQGMTQHWAHFDRPLAPVTTNDLHLTWDVPFTRGEIVAVGRDAEGHEIARRTLRPAGAPASLSLTCDRTSLPADGRSVAQLELALLDAQGLPVPDADLPVTLEVEGGTLLGMDNGRPDDRTPWRSPTRATWRGLAYAVVRAPRTPGTLRVRATAPGLEPVTLEIACT